MVVDAQNGFALIMVMAAKSDMTLETGMGTFLMRTRQSVLKPQHAVRFI